MTEEEKREIEEKIRYEESVRESIALEKKKLEEQENIQRRKKEDQESRKEYILETKTQIQELKRACVIKSIMKALAWYGLVLVIYLLLMNKVYQQPPFHPQKEKFIEAIASANFFAIPVIIILRIIIKAENKVKAIVIIPIPAILIMVIGSTLLFNFMQKPEVSAFLDTVSDTTVALAFAGIYTLMLVLNLLISIGCDISYIQSLQRTINEDTSE